MLWILQQLWSGHLTFYLKGQLSLNSFSKGQANHCRASCLSAPPDGCEDKSLRVSSSQLKSLAGDTEACSRSDYYSCAWCACLESFYLPVFCIPGSFNFIFSTNFSFLNSGIVIHFVSPWYDLRGWLKVKHQVYMWPSLTKPIISRFWWMWGVHRFRKSGQCPFI